MRGGLLANMVPVKTVTKNGHTVVNINTTAPWLREFVTGKKSGGPEMSRVQEFVDAAKKALGQVTPETAACTSPGSAPTGEGDDGARGRGRAAFDSDDESLTPRAETSSAQ